MTRILFLLFSILFSTFSWSQTESSMTLLDNRFRVDPTIRQITFVIYRAEGSRSVVLVRPDGAKYYAWSHPDKITWYEEQGLDIVSIDDPMPGPWQAVGRVTPKNNIKLLTNLVLTVDEFPKRLYENEVIKFTARLTQDGDPLVLQDFLNRVNLRVSFLRFYDEADGEQASSTLENTVAGTFRDDGQGLDEVSGDGVFTVEIPVTMGAGKYRAIITSGNGIFLRAVEQMVLVYPSPVQADFAQSREEGKDHALTIYGEQGMIVPGSLSVHIEQKLPYGDPIITQGSTNENQSTIKLQLPFDTTPGGHSWKGRAFATEAGTNRELVINFPETGYSVLKKVDIEKTTEEFKREEEARQFALEQGRILREREEARTKGMITILIGNLIVIVLGLLIWFIVRKLRTAKRAVPEMQLDAPPKL